MNKQQLIENLQFLFDNNNAIGLSMYFILKTEDGFTTRQADIEENVELKLKEQYLSYINEEILQNDGLNVADLSTADSRNNTIYSYDFDEMPNGLEIIGELLEEEEQELFNFGNDDFNNIFGFVFLLGSENNKIALYKKHYSINIIKRDSIFFIRTNRLVEAEDEMIRVNETFEFLQIGDEMIVLNVNTLEKFFGFESIIKNRALANIIIIENSNLLSDTTLLTEFADNLRFAKKLMKIRHNSEVFNLDFIRIRDFIRHHPKLRRINFNNQGTRIRLTNKKSAELFLKMLDDDFLKSDLTDLLYETDTKHLLRLMNQP